MPECFDGNDNWDTDKQQAYLSKLNLSYLEFPLSYDKDKPVVVKPETQMVLVGKSPRQEGLHAVIGRYCSKQNCLVLEFDPHEDNDFFGGEQPTRMGVLIPVNIPQFTKVCQNAKT